MFSNIKLYHLYYAVCKNYVPIALEPHFSSTPSLCSMCTARAISPKSGTGCCTDTWNAYTEHIPISACYCNGDTEHTA